MTHGTVTRSWARLERPAWFREVTEGKPVEGFGVAKRELLGNRDAKTMGGGDSTPG
jgi:hypothetical protein